MRKRESDVKVSVIIPVYNTKNYLKECLDSVLGQTLPAIEVVCVDDASTDGSADILAAYAARDPRVRVFTQEQNGGQALARNRGLEEAQGTYVYFLDSDDKIVPEAMEAVTEIASKNRLDGMLFNPAYEFETPELEERIKPNPFYVDEALEAQGVLTGEELFVVSEMGRYGHCQPGRYLWRTAYLKAHHIKNVPEASPHEDNEFALRAVMQAKRMMAVTGKYHVRRFREDSVMTGTDADTYIRRCRGAFIAWLEELDFIKTHTFQSMTGKEAALRYAAANRWMIRHVWQHIPEMRRQEIRFENPVYTTLFHATIHEITGEASSTPQTVPENTTQAEVVSDGMLVYGVGNHLFDMLSWHPDLAGRIERIFDKDAKKIGTTVAGVDKVVEPPSALKELPEGTQVAISAIRYYDEIEKELHALNSGIVCADIDDAYFEMPKATVATKPVSRAASKTVIRQELTERQRQRLRGRDALNRWRQRFLLDAMGCRHLFWGTRGIRATYLRRKLAPFMQAGDLFVEEDRSMRGQMVDGLPVIVPEALKDLRERFVIIVLSENYAQVRERLTDYGYVEHVDFVEGTRLLGEDEHGFIDLPCIDKAQAGMIVYGLGAHLQDMLRWHPELAGHIARVIDKDPKKVGTLVQQAGVYVESPRVLRTLPTGTEIAVSAIRYLGEITKDIHALQPGLLCRNIDDIWWEYVGAGQQPASEATLNAAPKKTVSKVETPVQKAADAKQLPPPRGHATPTVSATTKTMA